MNSSPRPEPGAALAPPALLRALHHLLRPLVRLLLANQVTYPILSRLLKTVYVEMADREFVLEGRPQTASRLSLLTGIHRKDIRRLRDAPSEVFTPPPSVSLGARLVLQWTGSPDFLDAEGRPLPLPLQAAGSTGPSFEDLVASVSTDIRPRSVFDEWQRLGVVELDAEGRVRLLVDAFVPSKGFDEKAHYFGRNVHDHLAVAAHNLAGGLPPMLERSVYCDGLSADSVAELRELAERVGMRALQTVNRRAMKLQEGDAERDDARLRMAFGSYFLRADTRDERQEPEPRADGRDSGPPDE